MSESMCAVYDAEQIRALETIAIEQYAIPEFELMCRAGQAVFDYVSKQWPMTRSLCILCGQGNNAGDGFIVALLAVQQGWQVQLLEMSQPVSLPAAAAQARQQYVSVNGAIDSFTGKLPKADIYIDALLGIGINRELTGHCLLAVQALNKQSLPVVAVDIPTGLHADHGRCMGGAVRATATISFIGLKQGLLTGEAAEYVGLLVLDELGLSKRCLKQVKTHKQHLYPGWVKTVLHRRSRIAHKGHFGHVLLVGGAPGMSGAIRLSAEAALRSGAGLVTVATHPDHASWINMHQPEFMTHALHNSQDLSTVVDKASVVAIGPGLGQACWSRQLLAQLMLTPQPKVLDADALNLLLQHPQHRSDWVLTPHPGEAARLLGCSVPQVEQDRFAAVTQLQKIYGGVVVLKGAGTLVSNGKEITICTVGNAGMATGGMGDVLTGVIAAMLAQGMGLYAAARVAVLIHGQAGDIAAEYGERGMLASDLIQQIRWVVNP